MMRAGAFFALALLLAGSAAAAEPPVAGPAIKVGLANTLNDATLYLAQDRGYFRDAGVEVEFVGFDSGGRMIAPLGAGQIDVGSGAISAGLYNAIERGVGIRIVADRGRTAPGYLYQTLVMRKDLITSGRVKTLADLKGLKFAAAAPGVTSLSVMNQAAIAGGLTYNDVEKVYLAFPQQTVALKNGAIDFATLIEPFVTEAVQQGFAVRWMSTEDFYPNNIIGVIFFGETMAATRPDVGRRFIGAYLRAVRDFVDASRSGKLDGPGADAVVASITAHYKVDPELVRTMYVQAINPNGTVTADELRKDWAFFRDQGLIKGSTPIEKIVDMSFVDAALKDIGKR